MAKSKQATAAKQKPVDPDHHGNHEIEEDLDKMPIALPAGAMRPSSLTDLIARMVHEQVQMATEDEFESVDEANDFEEDPDPDTLDLSPYELHLVKDEGDVPPPDESPVDPPSEPYTLTEEDIKQLRALLAAAPAPDQDVDQTSE